ncbi:MAG: hypothetical protein A3F17_06750 [Gammaproteobacteria bacterium RIFCSPHIGHO2_12_FULL_41_15]|nr:MAG: hypothetical protein A3F17_06750 [Gammaproteobacteria bacterium RIFCSPHIGHO2_12_FULL_41_15]
MSNTRSLVKKKSSLAAANKKTGMLTEHTALPPQQTPSSLRRFLAAPPWWFLGLILAVGLSLGYLPYYLSLHRLTNAITHLLHTMQPGEVHDK